MVEIVDLRNDIQPFFHHEDARLTEGISLAAETDILYWVDIYKAQIHRIQNYSQVKDSSAKKDNYDFVTISTQNYNETLFNVSYPKEHSNFKESIGVIFPNDDPETKHLIYFASKFGIGQFNFKTGEWGYIVLYSSCPILKPYSHKLRSNDGNVTRDGKYIIVGLMEDFMFDAGNSDLGCVLKIDLTNRTIEVLINGLKIPNAFHWNKDNTKMYVTDSLNWTIWEYAYDSKQNKLINSEDRRALFDIKKFNSDFESPEPDGSAIDLTNGLIYVCLWSTSQIQAYDLETGNLVKKFLLPSSTPRISCCCFAGNDLLVTSANIYVSDDEQKGNEQKDIKGGCLYRIPDAAQNLPLTSSTKVTLKF
ncbi:cell growth-regulated gene 1 protein [Monosporozyma servazzii]